MPSRVMVTADSVDIGPAVLRLAVPNVNVVGGGSTN